MADLIDRKSKRLFKGFFVFLLIIVVMSFYKYFIAKDYYIVMEIPCDPEIENCFVYNCEEEGDGCIEGEEYYKLLKKKAFLIPLCDPEDQACNVYECTSKMDCFIIDCNPDIDSCSNY